MNKKGNKGFNSISEVKLHTNRKGIIQILNTILKNVGDKRSISSKDSFERITKMIDYINAHHEFNVSCLVDWEKTKGTRSFNRNSMRKYNNGFAIINRFIRQGKNNYYMELLFDCVSDKEVWTKIVTQYLNTQWLVDFYILNEENKNSFCRGKRFTGSYIFTNNGETIICVHYTSDELDEPNELIDICPLHYGWVKLSIFDYSINDLMNEDITNETEQEISLLKRRFKYMFFQWLGFLKEIYKSCNSYQEIDIFSPFYFPENGE